MPKKISIFNVKGSTGKTPIAMNMHYDLGHNMVTNEPFNVLTELVPDDKCMVVDLEQELPNFPSSMNIIFDLAGSISKNAKSIPSALKQSDHVIVPINNEYKALKGGIYSIREVEALNKNIIVVATKLQKRRDDYFKSDWTKSKDFLDVQEVVRNNIKNQYPILPLKFSTAFDTIFNKECSVYQICQRDPLLRHSYAIIAKQMQDIYKHIQEV